MPVGTGFGVPQSTKGKITRQGHFFLWQGDVFHVICTNVPLKRVVYCSCVFLCKLWATENWTWLFSFPFRRAWWIWFTTWAEPFGKISAPRSLILLPTQPMEKNTGSESLFLSGGTRVECWAEINLAEAFEMMTAWKCRPVMTWRFFYLCGIGDVLCSRATLRFFIITETSMHAHLCIYCEPSFVSLSLHPLSFLKVSMYCGLVSPPH